MSKILLTLFALISWIIGTAQSQEKLLNYYPDSYDQARKRFITKAREIAKQHPQSQLFTFKIPSKLDQGLYMDVLYIPNAGKDRLLILSSGIHGVEGFTGSALQLMFMDKYLTDSLLQKTSVLIIHSINPYGFKYLRRVSENNVDLNRNSSLSGQIYSTPNPGYDKINTFVNPTGPVNLMSLKNKFFLPRALSKALKVGIPNFRQGLLGGQYKYPKGLYFGGFKQEPQIDTLAKFLNTIIPQYKLVMEIDLHTGYGKRGMLHLFPNPLPAPKRRLVEKIFSGYEINWGDTTKKFYTTTGDFIDFVGEIAGDNRLYIPMTFEYGTINSHTTLGGIKALHIMVLENQGHFHGYKHPRDERIVRKKFLKMYYPTSKKWRLKVMKRTIEVLDNTLPRFLNYPTK